MAKFAGQNVHKRIVTEESYREKRYDEALKRAFLGTDEDLLASESIVLHRNDDITDQPHPPSDPAHAKDPSGCTAVAALITDKEIYVVRPKLASNIRNSHNQHLYRPMRETPDPF